MTFRKDINGLRAIAVMAVVLFHFQVVGFSGGFVGVDIFFVISGYLMTTIIFTKLRDHRFSLIDFYFHRAKRIIPALAVLCLFLIAFGASFLYYDDYRNILNFASSSIQFTSNFSYYEDLGYFAAPASYNWLLHTWSLSVEWQFYILYPIIISIIYQLFSEKTTKFTLLFLSILSLIASITYTPINPSASFYLLPTRAWEMIAGGIIFLYPCTFPNLKRLSLISGILLIIISVVLFNDQYMWPSYFALVPVTGAMLIISANQTNIITDNIVFQWLGKISYSVYLWHWPIVVFLNTLSIQYDSIYITLFGIIASIILGALSYYAIEIRFKPNKSTKIGLVSYLLVIVVIVWLTNFIANILENDNQLRNSFYYKNSPISEKYTTFFNRCYILPDNFSLSKNCLFGEGKPSIIIMGDSHTIATFMAVDKVFSNQKNILLWGYTGCPVILGGDKKRLYCDVFLHDRFKKLKDYHNVPILIAMRYSLYLDPMKFLNYSDNIDKHLTLFEKNYTDTLCKLTKNNPVYILKPVPEMNTYIPKTLMLQKKILNQSLDIKLPLESYYQKNKRINNILEKASKQCHAVLIDPLPALCPDGKYCLGSKEGVSLYEDDNHLSEYGSQFLIPALKKTFIDHKVE